MLDFQKLSAQYKQALLRQVVPFWLSHSRDELFGGYFDMLTASGEVIEGDKFVTQQARQAWSFAWLYNTLDGQPIWLQHARHGAAFLIRYAHTDSFTCYAQLNRRGRPVAPSADILSECSVVMAYAQLHRATADDEWAMLAKQTLRQLLEHRQVVRAEQAATLEGFLPVWHLNESIALFRTLLDMQPLLYEETWKQQIDLVLQELLHEFVDRRTDTLRESVLPEGAFINTPEGRRINVGLTFQTASYLLDYYAESSLTKTVPAGNRKLATQAVGWCLHLCEQAWDETAGGLNQAVDFKQQPLIFSDWQQKWGWVQAEALNALIKSYFHTRQSECLKWFKRIHDYVFQHFPDPKHAGWHLAVDSYGQPIFNAKAIPSADCFSIIRCLTETAQLLTKCAQLPTKMSRTAH